MPPLTDPGILAQFHAVLANWNFTDYVTAKPTAIDWIANNFNGLSLRDVAKAMNDFCLTGGVIDQVPERRSEYACWPYHYDFRLQLAGKKIYIETILQDDDPKDPTIRIVSIHDV